MRLAHRSRPDSPCASRSIISENQFSGILPAAIARMPALLVLYAASCAMPFPSPRARCAPSAFRWLQECHLQYVRGRRDAACGDEFDTEGVARRRLLCVRVCMRRLCTHQSLYVTACVLCSLIPQRGACPRGAVRVGVDEAASMLGRCIQAGVRRLRPVCTRMSAPSCTTLYEQRPESGAVLRPLPSEELDRGVPFSQLSRCSR